MPSMWYGQFEWRLRQDPRVVLMERTNVRYLEPGAIAEPIDLIVIDVSFISLTPVLPAVVSPSCRVRFHYHADQTAI